jgi:hypothetical protein
MLLASLAKLLQLKSIFDRLLVLSAEIVCNLAKCALHLDHVVL